MNTRVLVALSFVLFAGAFSPAEAIFPEPMRASSPTAVAVLSLDQAIRLAWRMNPDLESAHHHLDLSEEGLSVARRELYPRVALNQEIQHSDNPLNKFSFLLTQGKLSANSLFNQPAVVSNYHTQVQAKYDILTGGARKHRIHAAEADVDCSEHEFESVKNQIAYQVAEAYYRLFQAEELVDVREEAVEKVESELHDVKARLKADNAVRSDVLLVELRLAEVRDSLTRAMTGRNLAWAVLENVVGAHLVGSHLPEDLQPAPWADHVDRIEVATAALADTSASGGGADPTTVEAKRARPDFKETTSKVRFAEEQIDTAKAGSRPSAQFVGNYDVFSGDLDTFNDSYFVGLAVSLNLFDAGRTKAAVRKAQANLREVISRNRRAELDIELDVRRSAILLKEGRERLKLSTAAVEQAGESLKEMESRRKNELATESQLLEAQLLVTDAHVRQTNSRADLEIARASLERAVGRISSFLEEKIPVSAATAYIPSGR